MKGEISLHCTKNSPLFFAGFVQNETCSLSGELDCQPYI